METLRRTGEKEPAQTEEVDVAVRPLGLECLGDGREASVPHGDLFVRGLELCDQKLKLCRKGLQIALQTLGAPKSSQEDRDMG